MKPLPEPFLLIVSGFVLAAWGCGQEQPPPRLPASGGSAAAPSPAQPSAPPAAAAATVDGRVTIGSLGFPIPEGWVNSPPSNQMRIAELVVPDPGGDPARRCVAAFSRAGGDVELNINRWAGQVLDSSGVPATPVVARPTISGLRVHVVELTGTYQDGMPGGGASTPRSNWMLRGAIIEASDGLVFVKMTGPADAMGACTPGWKALIDGMTTK